MQQRTISPGLYKGITDIPNAQNEVVGRPEYTFAPATPPDITNMRKGDFLPWQKNVIQYSLNLDSEEIFLTAEPGTGKSGMFGGTGNILYKYNQTSSNISTTLKYLSGNILAVRGIHFLVPNLDIRKQILREFITIYSEPGTFPDSEQKLLGPQNKAVIRAITQDLGVFYRIDSATSLVSALFWPAAKKDMEETGTTYFGKNFDRAVRENMDYMAVFIDEVAHSMPTDKYDSKLAITAGEEQITPKMKQLFERKINPEGKGTREGHNQYSGPKTAFILYEAIRRARGVRVMIASATPVRNPKTPESVLSQLNLIHLKSMNYELDKTSDFTHMDEHQIYERVKNITAGKVSYMSRSISGAAIRELGEDYIVDGENYGKYMKLPLTVMQMKAILDHGGEESAMSLYSSLVYPDGSSVDKHYILQVSSIYKSKGETKDSETGATTKEAKEKRNWDYRPRGPNGGTWANMIKDRTWFFYSNKQYAFIHLMIEHNLRMIEDYPEISDPIYGLGVVYAFTENVHNIAGAYSYGIFLERQQEYKQYSQLNGKWDFIGLRSSVKKIIYIDNEGRTRVDPSYPKQFRYCVFSAETPVELRNEILMLAGSIDNMHGEYLKLILGTRASGTGVTIQNGSLAVILETPNSEAMRKQAEGRITRLNGQTQIVEALRKSGNTKQFTIEIARFASVLQPINVGAYNPLLGITSVFPNAHPNVNVEIKDFLSNILETYKVSYSKLFSGTFKTLNRILAGREFSSDLASYRENKTPNVKSQTIVDTMRDYAFDRNLNATGSDGEIIPTPDVEANKILYRYENLYAVTKSVELSNRIIHVLSDIFEQRKTQIISQHDILSILMDRINLARETLIAGLTYIVMDRHSIVIDGHIYHVLKKDKYIYLAPTIFSQPPSTNLELRFKLDEPKVDKRLLNTFVQDSHFEHNILRGMHISNIKREIERSDDKILANIAEHLLIFERNSQPLTDSQQRFLNFFDPFLHNVRKWRPQVGKFDITSVFDFSVAPPPESRAREMTMHNIVRVRSIKKYTDSNMIYTHYARASGIYRVLDGKGWRNTTENESRYYGAQIIALLRENIRLQVELFRMFIIKITFGEFATSRVEYKYFNHNNQDVEQMKYDNRSAAAASRLGAMTRKDAVEFLFSIDADVFLNTQTNINSRLVELNNIDPKIKLQFRKSYLNLSETHPLFLNALSWAFASSKLTGPNRVIPANLQKFIIEQAMNAGAMVDIDLTQQNI